MMDINEKLRNQLAFFGISPETAPIARANLFTQIHEILFYGQGGYDYETIYNMPLWLRRFTYNKINPAFTKLSYQNTLLSKIYKNCGLLSPIEFFDLEKMPFAIIAMISCFDYVHQHNENLIKDLKIPIYFNDHKYMILANNAQYQLNIVDYYNIPGSKYQSLNDVINNCCTHMGKRSLKYRLCAPYTDINIINKSYELTEKIINTNKNDDYRKYLKGIYDLDKLFRKLSIKFIQPYELYLIYESFQNITELLKELIESDIKNNIFEMFTKKNIKLINSAINYIEETFIIEKLKINNLVEIKESFYTDGIHLDIDEIEKKILNSIGIIEKLSNTLQNFDENITLYIKHNDRDGYYLSTTKQRGLKLEKIFNSKNTQIEIDTDVFINSKDIIFSYQTNTCKIFTR
jgi:DNA mismatch repair protein MutS